MLFALGAGNRVVGRTSFCNYPPEAKQKPKIGGYTDPNIETIASLRPDLVLLQTNPVRLAERLRVMKLNVVEIDQHASQMAGIGGHGGHDNAAIGGNVAVIKPASGSSSAAHDTGPSHTGTHDAGHGLRLQVVQDPAGQGPAREG